jgi:hypothetical protein
MIHRRKGKGTKERIHLSKERQQLSRQTIIRILGGKCVTCGFQDWRALQVDHIKPFPGPNRLVNPIQLLTDIRKSLREGVQKYQLLCANCNWIKRYENNEINIRYKVPADLSSGESVQNLNTNLSEERVN